MSTPSNYSVQQEAEQQIAMVAHEIPEEAVGTSTPKRTPPPTTPASDYSPPNSNTISPASTQPGVTEIVEENEDSVVDVTPHFQATSPSILSKVGKRVGDGIRAIAEGPTFTRTN
jgi:hypothetical protein